MAKPNPRVIYKAHKSAEWYTEPRLVELARRCLGGVIDFDPCTHELNPTGATIFQTKANGRASLDGVQWAEKLAELELERTERTLYMNPPFGKGIADWLAAVLVCRAELERRGLQLRALVLIPARVGARWYALHARSCDLVTELHGRPCFWQFRRRTGRFVKAKNGARWGCTLFYSGSDIEAVFDMLEEHGATRYAAVRRRRARSASQPPAPDPRQAALAFPSNVVPIR